MIERAIVYKATIVLITEDDDVTPEELLEEFVADNNITKLFEVVEIEERG